MKHPWQGKLTHRRMIIKQGTYRFDEILLCCKKNNIAKKKHFFSFFLSQAFRKFNIKACQGPSVAGFI